MFENIKGKLSQNSTVIEKALSGYYDFSDKDYASLIEAQRYGLLDGGKRIRAFLVLEFCRILGGESKNAVPYACARNARILFPPSSNPYLCASIKEA